MTDDDRGDARAETAVAWFLKLQDCDDEAVWVAHRDWLESDPAHAAAYARVEAAWIAAEDGAIRRVFARDAGVAEIHHRRDRRAAWPRRWMGLGARVGVGIPVAVAASVAAIIAWPSVTRPPVVPDIAYRTDATHRRDIALADGSRVTLNRDTVLTARVDAATRAVTLVSGEAAFDVRHDAAHPFVVAVAGREVRVLGTAFGVTARDGAFAVAVARGAVSVSAGDASARTVRVSAGTALSRPRGATQDRLEAIAPENAVPWQTGALSYTAATLAVVARDYERLVGVPVLVDPAIRDLPVSGIFQARDEAELIRQIEIVLPVRVVRTPAGRHIVPATR